MSLQFIDNLDGTTSALAREGSDLFDEGGQLLSAFDEGGQLLSEARIPFHGSWAVVEQLLQIQSTPEGREALYRELGLC